MTPETTAAQLVAGLQSRGQTVATAESLTGGLIGATITAIPGASQVYLGGAVVYATALKHVLAGVSEDILQSAGAVSPQTAIALAEGIQARTGADWAIAVTGVAGPDPQEGHQPGTVWLGLVGPGHPASATLLELSGSREQIRVQTVDAAMSRLLLLMQGSASSS